MFTRYSVPKNYSGSLFSANQYETETKTHSPSGVKTSISPSFNRENLNTPPGKIENPPFFSVVDDDTPESSEDLSSDINANDIIEVDGTTEVSKTAKEGISPLEEFKQGAIKLFENMKSDDIMLIALILLLSGENNPSIPLFLAILLLF